MVIDNLRGPIKEAMVLGDFRTFPQLFECMQRSGSITFLRNWGRRQAEEYPKNPAANSRGYHHSGSN